MSCCDLLELCGAVLCCDILCNAMLRCAVLCCAVCAVLGPSTRLSQGLTCLYSGWSFCEAVQLTVGLREVLYPFSMRDSKCKKAFSVVRRATILFNYPSINGQRQ